MPDTNEAVKTLYQKIVLRDIFAFITPGAILLLSVLYLFENDFYGTLRFFKEAPFLLFLPVVGLFYALGVLCLSVGAFISERPVLPVHRREHFLEHLNIINDFNRLAKDNAGARFQHEQFIVLKQICGNNAVAVFLSGIIILLKFFLMGFGSRWVFPALSLSAISIMISLLLYHAHKRYLEQQELWEDLYLNSGK